MVLLDICVASGLTYSIFGNIYHYIKTKKNIEIDIQELHGETNILRVCDYKTSLEIPSFVNTDTPGVMIPVGGCTNEEIRKIYCCLKNKEDIIFIKNDEVSSTITYKIKYINTNEDLKWLYNKYNIVSTSFPVRLPLKIYEKTITEPIYYNNLYFDVNKNNLLIKTMFENRKPFTFVVLGCSLLVLGYSWINYEPYYYHTKNQYPIFHPKRY